MANNPVNVEELGSGVGTKRAAAAIAFRLAVERRAAKTVGVHMETLVCDCEAAWTAQANVTATAHADGMKVGTYGAKLVVGAAFTTGLVATYDFAAKDLSGSKYIGFWIKSTLAHAAGIFRINIDEHAACVSPSELLDIPALAAGVWRYVKLPFADVSTRAATISVGLTAVSDPVEPTIYIDDIRVGSEYIGVADEMQSKDAYALYDPVHIMDQGKVEVGLLGTALSGQYLEPVGNGKFAVNNNGVTGGSGQKTHMSAMMAVEDQAVAAGTVPARMV